MTDLAEQFIKSIDHKVSVERDFSNNVSCQEVTIFSDHVIVKSINGVDKAISLLDFKQILDSQVSQGTSVAPVKLPLGAYLFGKSTNQIEVNMYFPEEMKTIKYVRDGRTKEITLPFPNLIIYVKLAFRSDHWAVVDSHYFATHKKVGQLPNQFISRVDLANQIWPLPFSNVYDDGRLCFGNNTMTVRFKDDLSGLFWYYRVLFEAPFNDDLGIKNVSHGPSVSAWYTELSKLKAFPYEKLSGYSNV